MKNDNNLLATRARILGAIREYFMEQKVMEVDVPQLVSKPDLEPTIELFSTELHQPQKDFEGYLIPSPEFQMKQLIANDSGDIYWMGHCFRNYEPIGSRHNPEFTMLEWYRIGKNYFDLMDDCRLLIQHVARSIESQLSVQVVGEWEKLSVIEAFDKYAGVRDHVLFDEKLLKKAAKDKGYQINQDTSYDDLFYQILLQEIESHLGQDKPIFLYDYPKSQAALAKISGKDPRVAERFELYINGVELANAFTELTDWQEQEKRLNEQQLTRMINGQQFWDVDDRFISALKKGLPECAGISLGLDRLIMLLAGKESIDQVLSFPADQLFAVTSSK